LLAVFTFGFVVLFEHGPAKFSEGAKTQWNALLYFAGSVLSKEENIRPAQPTPTPAATPAAQNPASPKATQTGSETNRPAKETPTPHR
jgi:hypothetical protein